MRRLWLLALAGGLIAALGHAPFHLWYVALSGFVAISWAVMHAGRPAQGARVAWWAGAGYFAVALHWIVEPFLVDAATHGWMAPGALVLLAGGLALFWAAAGWLAVRLGGTAFRTGVGFAVALGAAELLRGHVLTGFPWAMPAYIWADTPLLAATAYTGSYGLTVLTLLGATGLALWRIGLVPPVLAACGFALLLGAGGLRLSQGEAPTQLGTVGLVHPNIPQPEKWARNKVPEHIDRMLALTREVVADGAVDLVLWPEVSVVYPLDVAGPVLTAASEAAGGVPVMLGINRRDGDDWFNALVEVGASGQVGAVYDKVHLVPFGEYIPFRLGFLRAMAATGSNGFSSGESVRLLDTPLGKALPLICYEGIFPGHVFKAGARADYILLVTNDAWFGTFAGPYQHLDQARFRAAEQGLPVVRAANVGVSALIDRFGAVSDPLDLDETGVRSGVVRTGPPTVYARTGDLPLIGFLLLSATVLWLTRPRNTIANDRASV
ncbi:MAG: apolipoprotein N-acyltransferase [Pseudomonadota bacterium]